jgi:hypothetical protein
MNALLVMLLVLSLLLFLPLLVLFIFGMALGHGSNGRGVEKQFSEKKEICK